MTKRERIVCGFIEQAIPSARVHAQVSMGAILQPARGLDRSRATSVRNRFSSKRVDFLLEDRAGKDLDFLAAHVARFMAAAQQRPELAQVSTTFIPTVPQVFVDVDRDKTLKQGVNLGDQFC